MRLANRLAKLQSNVFSVMDEAKALARGSGKTIIDLSLGSSDLSAPEHALQAIRTALADASSHGYLLFHGTRSFREACADWYELRYGLQLDPDSEVLPLIGSQEGTAHLPLAVLNPGDVALLLDPGYPSHSGGVHLAGGQVYPLSLLPENGFLPQLERIPAEVVAQSRMLVLSYPHNPTAALAPLEFFEQAVGFCRTHDIVLVHDFPYADMAFEGYRPPSILQADPGRTVAIEFFSLSKSYHMGGFRIGFAVGNRALVAALRQVKTCVDFNQYRGILDGAVAALRGPQDHVQLANSVFQKRRDRTLGALARAGWSVPTPQATMYLWATLPPQWSDRSVEFCVRLVEQTGVALAPGAGFGRAGEGYVRFALVHAEEVLEDAVERTASFLRAANRSS